MPHLLLPTGELRPCRLYGTVPIGAALVILTPSAIPEEFDLPGLAAEHPWTPVAIQESGHPHDGTISRLLKGHPSLRNLVVLKGRPEDAASALRQALLDEGAPTRAEMAEYILHRCDRGAKFATALKASVRGDGSVAQSTIHSQLKGQGRLTQKHWVMLHELLRSLAVPHGFRRSDAAEVLAIDVRTLNGYCTRFLPGMDWDDARKRFGWRWLVEEVLRREGYVARGQEGKRARGQERKFVSRN